MRVYVTRSIPDDLLARIASVGDVEVWDGDEPVPQQVLLSAVGSVDGLLCMLTDRIDAGLLDAAPRLRVVSQMSVGVDNIDVAACLDRGIRVGHTPDVLTGAVADHAFGLLLAAARRFGEGARRVADGEWGVWDPWDFLGVDVSGTTLGVVGMGRLGNAIASRAAGFGMEVIYSSRRETGEIGTKVSLEALLAASDHVMVTVPLTEETRGMFGAEVFARMKPTATFVNVSRGPVVDQDALLEALRGGVLFAAALDVTDPEPLPPDHPLVVQPNCLIVPHIGSATQRTRESMASLAVDNLIAGLEGGEMPAEVPGDL